MLINILYKFFWRIKFLLLESWRKDGEVIICSIKSANKRREYLGRILHNRKIIKWDEYNGIFQHDKLKFYYKGLPPTLEFIDIYASNFRYIKKNFANNSAYVFEGPYEKNNAVLKMGDYVIDAGAHIGLFSLLASKKIGSRGKVFSFEPVAGTRELLQKNIAVNKVDNIVIAPYALGKNDREIEFNVSDNTGESSARHLKNSTKEKIKQITLDKFLLNNSVKKVDFIKADIEGMERDLLEGAEKTIKKFKPIISICIYHNPDDHVIIENIIKKFVPEYNIIKTKSKLYAWI